jgi:hypothetical protein
MKADLITRDGVAGPEADTMKAKRGLAPGHGGVLTGRH